jgi:hypothetical protein
VIPSHGTSAVMAIGLHRAPAFAIFATAFSNFFSPLTSRRRNS